MPSMNIYQASQVATNMLACTNSTTWVDVPMSYLSIYSGAMPTVNAAFSWNPATYANVMLYQKTDATYVAVSQASPAVDVGIKLTEALTAQAPTRTGTASWYAIHNGVAGQPAILGSCTSIATATDTLLLNTTNLVLGTNFTIFDLTIRFIGTGS